MYFGTKSYLKSTRNHTAKHALRAFLRSFQLFILILKFYTSFQMFTFIS